MIYCLQNKTLALNWGSCHEDAWISAKYIRVKITKRLINTGVEHDEYQDRWCWQVALWKWVNYHGLFSLFAYDCFCWIHYKKARSKWGDRAVLPCSQINGCGRMVSSGCSALHSLRSMASDLKNRRAQRFNSCLCLLAFWSWRQQNLNPSHITAIKIHSHEAKEQSFCVQNISQTVNNPAIAIYKFKPNCCLIPKALNPFSHNGDYSKCLEECKGWTKDEEYLSHLVEGFIWRF